VRVEISTVMSEHGHEQVVLVADPSSQLRAVIAIHSTALGPSLGGIRFWRYDHDADGIRDALRLAEAMTWKAAVAGLDQGGGKAVVFVDDPDAPRRPELLRALGRAIDALGGRYLAAEDVGATTRDMDLIATVTPWVTGVSEADGGSGDPSPVTALGVVHAMQAVVRARDGDDATLAGRRVAIQGAGKVGAHLARLVTEAGASVVVADVNDDRARAVAARCAGRVVGPGDILGVDCDVLAPCAMGGVLNEATVDALRCSAVCGAANNQLDDPSIDIRLAARGVVYVPDFVAGAGGIINIAEEFHGYSRTRALERTASIEDTTATVLARAVAETTTPERVARAMARERVAGAGPGRRWQPGDAAAWTHGQPLRSLRPASTVNV
jgi:glutamate dehydrogenase/leucine dehydrogenase